MIHCHKEYGVKENTLGIKILYTRGDQCYIVQKGEFFYLLDLDIDSKPLVSKYFDSFLKFGYFTEVKTIDKNELYAIERRFL